MKQCTKYTHSSELGMYLWGTLCLWQKNRNKMFIPKFLIHFTELDLVSRSFLVLTLNLGQNRLTSGPEDWWRERKTKWNKKRNPSFTVTTILPTKGGCRRSSLKVTWRVTQVDWPSHDVTILNVGNPRNDSRRRVLRITELVLFLIMDPLYDGFTKDFEMVLL